MTNLTMVLFNAASSSKFCSRAILCSLMFLAGSSISRAEDPIVAVIKTSKGDIKVELDIEKAPITVENFIKYAKDDFYDGTIFHRVIEGFMIQCGGFTEGLQKKETRGPIENESSNGLENLRYTLAMARTPAPNSATSQFFINADDNDFLNKSQSGDGVGYAVFGKVVEGFEVVDAIEVLKTGTRNRMSDVPIDTVTINDVEIIEDDE